MCRGLERGLNVKSGEGTGRGSVASDGGKNLFIIHHLS